MPGYRLRQLRSSKAKVKPVIRVVAMLAPTGLLPPSGHLSLRTRTWFSRVINITVVNLPGISAPEVKKPVQSPSTNLLGYSCAILSVEDKLGALKAISYLFILHTH